MNKENTTQIKNPFDRVVKRFGSIQGREGIYRMLAEQYAEEFDYCNQVLDVWESAVKDNLN